jgi:hypothetical protein
MGRLPIERYKEMSPKKLSGLLSKAKGATLGATRSRLQTTERAADYSRTAPKPPNKINPLFQVLSRIFLPFNQLEPACISA